MNFKTRGFVSITLALSFIILSLSGIVLYIMPHGRIAYWINWKIIGLCKDDWDAVHTIVGFVFMLMAVVHFYLNWSSFVSYLRSKIQKRACRLSIFFSNNYCGYIMEYTPFQHYNGYRRIGKGIVGN